MPTVLVATSTFPRWSGDAVPARFVFDLSLQLKRHFNVIVLAPHAPGAAFRETIEGLEIYRFPYFWPYGLQALCNGGGIMPALRSGMFQKIQAPFLFIMQWYHLIKILKTHSIDLINSHWMIPQGFSVALAKLFFPRIPHLLTIHSTDAHILRRAPGGRSLSRFIAKSADGIISVSHFVHNMVENITEMEIDRHILPMGVYSQVFAPKIHRATLQRKNGIKSRFVVLYVGKLIEVKGVKILIESMASLRQTHDACLLIAGAGALRTELEQKAREFRLADHVRFLGPVAHDKLVDLYTLCDVVVVPSIVTARQETEGMPVVILEALSAGCPVVASDVGGIKDVIKDNVNGYLVPPGKPRILAEHITRILHPEVAQKIRMQTMESVRNYDWHRVGDEYYRIVQELCIKTSVS